MISFEEFCETVQSGQVAINENLLAAIAIAMATAQSIVISSKHCRHLQQCLGYIALNIFGVEPFAYDCSAETSWRTLSEALVKQGNGAIPSFIILSHLDLTSRYVQAQLVDSLSKGRIVIDSHIYEVPELFIMAAVVSTRREESGSFLSHLKELLFLWYHYELENEMSTIPTPQKNELISPDYLVWLRNQARKVTIVADVRRYMQDIVIFLRTHRLVRRGVSTKACRDFDLLVRCLCVLHNYEFATPSIVAIAARKIFPLKIEMCDPYDEPTLQYGGDVQLIAKWMKQWDQELIIENVLEQVDPPL